MYEYAPKLSKKYEKRVTFCLFLLGFLFFGASMPSFVPLPALLQLFSFICFVAAIPILSKILLCNYVYRVEERSDVEGAWDLVITEHCRSRTRVVGRIALSEVVSVLDVTDGNAKKLKKEYRQIVCYRYMGVLRADNVCLLISENAHEKFGVYILADERLKTIILNR